MWRYRASVKLLRLGAILAGIPLIVMTVIGVILLNQGQSENGRSTIAVGVIVAATSGASVIYQIEGWTLQRRTLAHFALMVVTVLPALLLSGWFALDTAGGVFLVVGIFLAAGVALWTIFYLIYRLTGRRARATA